jgi:hypothetical protein
MEGIMSKLAAIYVRVSTDKQTVENKSGNCARSLSAGAGRLSSNIAMPAYQVLRAAMAVLVSI